MSKMEPPEPLSQRPPELSNVAVASQSSMIDSPAESSGFSFQSASGSQRSVELHIEELVLNGCAPADRYTIGEAVERELTRMLIEQGAPPAIARDVEIAHLNAGAINVKPGARAEATGIQLARAIYGGLGK